MHKSDRYIFYMQSILANFIHVFFMFIKRIIYEIEKRDALKNWPEFFSYNSVSQHGHY